MAAAPSAAAGAQHTAAAAAPLQTAQENPAAGKEHLVVMVHGLFGTRDNWTAISDLLAEHLDPSATLLFVSHCNERTRTFDGVDACGERLAEEIRGVAAQHPELRRISVLGHSMGGLIGRYAAGRLYDPSSGTMAGLAPCHFVAMATPHLGCDSIGSPAQVPLISWLAAVPAVGAAVQGLVSELAPPLTEAACGQAGRQFFLLEEEEASSLSPLQQLLVPLQQQLGQASQPAASRDNPDSSSSSSSSRRRREPLLYRLTEDQPQEGLYFMSALASFESRTLYANSSGDHLVGWANSSLRRLAELPQRSGKGTGVVREDPLESAWAPSQRPALHSTAAAEALHSDQSSVVGQAAILEARGSGQLAASSAHSNSGNGSGLQGEGAAEAAELVGFGAQSARAGSGAAMPAPGSSSSSSSSSSSLTAARERRVEEMLVRLQAVSWRRVDVCFGATLLPLLSHQHIQMQRWWVNWPGRAVVKHLALQLQAMEELRLRGQLHAEEQQRQPGRQQQQQTAAACVQRQQEQPAPALAGSAPSVRDDLMRGVNADHREAVARIVEQAQRAADSWTVLHSDFHTPPVVADALMVLQRMADVGGVAWGGYSQAERCRVVVGREEMAAEADPSQLGGVAAVEVSGNFMFDPANHRDFLGACLGTGIDRDKVGDILVAGERGAQILVAPTLVEHLETALTQVRTVPVQTRAISLDSLQVRAPQVQELSSVEASMRLDAVASAGFRMSRSKMMELIKSGDVRVNWQSGAKPSTDVAPGDMVSVSGKGRLEVKAANRTAKGKWSVQMVRYL